jgi:hypothetical protein
LIFLIKAVKDSEKTITKKIITAYQDGLHLERQKQDPLGLLVVCSVIQDWFWAAWAVRSGLELVHQLSFW